MKENHELDVGDIIIYNQDSATEYIGTKARVTAVDSIGQKYSVVNLDLNLNGWESFGGRHWKHYMDPMPDFQDNDELLKWLESDE